MPDALASDVGPAQCAGPESGFTREELADLYHDRWEDETIFDEIKTHLCDCPEGRVLQWSGRRGATVNRPVVFRGKTPDRVVQELWGMLIAYNAVRKTMHEAARRKELDARRVSFTSATERVREATPCLKSLALRLAMVVPSEILHVLHAGSLRHYLLGQCSRILMLDPAKIWFNSTLQGVVLLLAEKRRPGNKKDAKLAVVPLNGRGTLNGAASRHFARAAYVNGSAMNGKWMLALLSSHERELLRMLRDNPQVKTFKESATVDVGLVTGANKFFLVPDHTVADYGLDQWAHPMFGRSEHVPGVLYDRKTHEQNRRKGLPTNFIWFHDTKRSDPSKGALRYIKLGERQNLHHRYKCRIREPWYEVPSVYVTPVGLLKRAHHFPRLVLNRRGAYTTDTAYRIQVHGVSARTFVQSFVNSLTALTAELEGRHYGGGVLELVPSEIEKLLIPLPAGVRSDLTGFDARIRRGAPEQILRYQDRRMLLPLGLSQREIETVHAAWTRLRNRRQRKNAGD